MPETRFRLATIASLVFFSLAAEAGMQHRLDRETVAPLQAPLAAGARVQLDRIPLVDGEPATLDLERFEVWAEGADIKVFGGDGHVLQTLPIPAAQYFRGRVRGDADSIVFLTSSGGSVDGLIYSRDRKFAVGSRRASTRGAELELVVEESSLLDDFPAHGGFTCDVESAEVSAPGRRPYAVTNAFGEPETQAAPTGTQRSLLHIAVETDYELFTRADSVAANVTTFIGNLLGAASTIYERDLLTELRVSYLGIYTTPSDPFNVVPGVNGATSFDALTELGTRWKTAAPTSNVRSAVAMVSGKSQMAGVAWVRTMCDPGYYYSYNGGIDPPANLSVPDPDAGAGYAVVSSNYWPLLQFTHELGHNVGSKHTHCVSLTSAQKTQYGVTRDFVDNCRTGESGCFTGTESVPLEKGSIMSYCHLKGGSQTRFTFGQPNETSEVIRNNMRGYLAAVTPALSAITAPASLASGASAVASVTNGGLAYTWQITNGTFTGGGTTASGPSVTFQGTTNPITLKVTGTNATGCAVTDTRIVSLGVVNVVAPVGVTATASGTSSVSVSWLAVNNATGYQIHRSAGGGVFTQVGTSTGTSFSDGTAAAGAAYLYKVRATNAGGSGPFSSADVATLVTFSDPALDGATVRLVHLTQLRQAANALRALAGLPSLTADATIGANLPMRGSHILQVRDGIAAARTSLALPALAWSGDASAGATIRATDLSQLRNGVS